MKSLAEFIKVIGDLPNTFWGIIILFSSMYIAVKYNSDIGYYFAGVGSTLCGIAHVQNRNMAATFSQDPTKVKVETDAGNSSS